MSDEPVNATPEGPPKKDWPSLVIVAVLLLAAIAVGWRQTTGGNLLPDDTIAPSFSVRGFQGSDISLSSLKGRVVVLNFWATWCPPCRDEMPYVVKLGSEYQDKGVSLVAVSMDESDVAPETVGHLVSQMPALGQFAAYANSEVAVTYKVGPIPTTYVIDPTGKIYASVEGQVSESTLRRWIEGASARR